MEKLTCSGAKQIDLVDYLASLGHQPQKVTNQDYWYLSPLREEKTPSFKVNRKLNMWYDHATGKGGNLINFGTQYFKCSVADLLRRLSGRAVPTFSFHPQQQTSQSHNIQNLSAGEKKENPESKIVILGSRVLADKSLLDYLQKRNIPQDIASRFCREVDFLLYGKKQTVIGFQNNAGGYELRSQNFKGSSSPKDTTFIDNGSKLLDVFEGFFNYLSYRTMIHKAGEPLTNFLVLNSLSFFEKSRNLMENHEQVNLYLDRDKAGINCTQEALKWNQYLYKDQSHLYSNHKDLNDWFVKKQPDIKQGQKIGRSF
ncbi:DNA primase [Sediminibacterium roseum]|uniref:DNA primase n=1 Tax=Sediminibacterium roseum TaxID=1978412 RepID=A0ABW9ZQ45_9BACT|nr:toprim domain-containing protein [Sediminibacterium roseum]NCI49195.1 DNA primase [Sediminibacterium roseum]